MNIKTEIRERLFSMQDLGYRDFQCRLMPTVDKSKVIGVRTPQLRAYAKELAKAPDIREFLAELPHEYYEENNLHAAIIEQRKDYDEVIALLDAFLPYVDNWATCDMMSPKVLKKHKAELIGKIDEWLASGRLYTVRFAVGMLMAHYLDGDFREEHLARVAAVETGEYYLSMMVAWYFATALAKQYDAALGYLDRLDKATRNRTIQKAIESYRITAEQKEYLRTLKVK